MPRPRTISVGALDDWRVRKLQGLASTESGNLSWSELESRHGLRFSEEEREALDKRSFEGVRINPSFGVVFSPKFERKPDAFFTDKDDGQVKPRFAPSKKVQEIQELRSERAKAIDASIKAPLAKTEREWINNPNRVDIKGVDYPEEKTRKEEPKPEKKEESLQKVPLGDVERIAYEKARESTEKALASGKSRDEVVRQLDSAMLQLQTTSMFATKGGFGGTLDYDRVMATLEALKRLKADVTEGRIGSAEKPKLTNSKQKSLEAFKPSVSSTPSATAIYNKATGWLSLSFSGVPSFEVRSKMKSMGFRYKPSTKRWRASFTTGREDFAKELAGKIETIDVKPNWAAKAEAAASQAEKHFEKSSEAYEHSNKIADAIPFGQPILVGHHSEKRHRADIERIQRGMDKSIEEQKIGEEYQERAERYGKLASGENPITIFNRIKKLEADKRKMERELAAGEGEGTIYYAGHISEGRKAEIKRWIAHYDSRLEVEREKYKASGGIAAERIAFQRGDRVNTRFGTGTIASISKNTARVKLDSGTGIYENARGESLLSIADIKGKL